VFGFLFASVSAGDFLETQLQNDVLCVERDINLYSLTHSVCTYCCWQ